MNIGVHGTYYIVSLRGLLISVDGGGAVEESDVRVARCRTFVAVVALGLLALSGRWRIIRLFDMGVFHESQEGKLSGVCDYGDEQDSVA